ncbi:hypothetical protein DL346_24815 [Paenibacillus montanisoli]|uniref:Uncharacterized protein n=1 Tax=Paenibacillus montanisoli TaxID=2081970 RepID=A0A328TYQ2_9BACL|nr:hypothetical protein DL346_24815 [Paenibacillus montanisoli]
MSFNVIIGIMPIFCILPVIVMEQDHTLLDYGERSRMEWVFAYVEEVIYGKKELGMFCMT